MSTEATESVTWVRHLIRTAESHGLQLDEGPTAHQPAFSTRIGVDHAQHLWERAARALGPSIPLLVAASEEHTSLLYLAALSCRTIGEALQLTVAHWRYVTDGFPAMTIRRDGAVHLRFAVEGAMPLGGRLGVEYLLALLVRAGRQLTGGAWRPTELILGHRPPIGLDVWESICSVPVHVASEPPGLVMAESSLAQPVQSQFSRAAGRYFVELLDWYTPRARATPTLTDRVAQALARDLGPAAPTVEQVAAELGFSARSLHRQLAAQGTSYQRLLDRLRCDEAIRQTLEGHQPFKAIAAAVGFADPRAFRRAFKRWTGTTPQEFRLRHLARSVEPTAA